MWRHTLLERRSLRLARLTHFGLPVDVEHTPTMFAHCNNRSPVPIIRLPGITLAGFASRHAAERIHISTEKLCYQSQLLRFPESCNASNTRQLVPKCPVFGSVRCSMALTLARGQPHISHSTRPDQQGCERSAIPAHGRPEGQALVNEGKLSRHC